MGACPGEWGAVQITITSKACMDRPTSMDQHGCLPWWESPSGNYYNPWSMYGWTNMQPMLVERYKDFFKLLRQTAACKLDSLSLPWKQASLATNLISFESRSLHTSWAPASWSIKPQEAQTNKQTRFHVSVQDRDNPFLFQTKSHNNKNPNQKREEDYWGVPTLESQQGWQ